MATPANSSRGNRPPRPSAPQRAALRLLAEQVAVPVDQFRRFVGEGAAELAGRLEKRGWVACEELVAGESPWLWLTKAGGECEGSGFAAKRPKLIGLAHLRAINEVRLGLQERAPDAEWTCERELWRRWRGRRHVADGVLEIDGRRHAIEVELSRKSRAGLLSVIAQHSERYDLVVYFCGPDVRSQLDAVAAEGSWPKLVVRDVPGGEATLAAKAWSEPLEPELPRLPTRQPGSGLAGWEAALLRLLCEQGAVPLDQLSRLLESETAALQRVVEKLESDGLVAVRLGPAGEPPWIWATEEGVACCGTPLRFHAPALGGLEQLRIENEVRLRVAGRVPGALWVSRRMLSLNLSPGVHRPSALVELEGASHAVEIDTAASRQRLLERIVECRAEFDAVVVFSSPLRVAWLEELKQQRGWDDVALRILPTGSRS